MKRRTHEAMERAFTTSSRPLPLLAHASGRRASAVLVALFAVACDTAPEADAAVARDAAPLADGSRDDGGRPQDGGSATDAASVRDAALDGGAPADGGATSMDGGAPGDGGADAGTLGDSGAAGGADGGSLAEGGLDASSEDAGAPIVPTEIYAPRAYVEQGASQPDPTSVAPIVFDVSFDEPILASSLRASDFAIEPAVPLTATLTDSGDHQRFELRLTDLPHVDARYRVSLPYGRAIDTSGNPNEPSVSTDNQVVHDHPGSTVEVRPYVGVRPVMNTLPITFQIVFQALAVVGFDVGDVINGGTAPGVVWELEALTPGYTYLVRATAVGAQGTVTPVIPAAATLTPTGVPNLESVYVGEVVTYTPLPILRISDAVGNEGSSVTFSALFDGALRPSTETVFDWATRDGTALAGVHYTARDVMDAAIAAGAGGVILSVPAVPDNDIPELDTQFTVRLTNVRGGVFVADDTAVGIVRNNDRGTYSFGGNRGSNPETGGTAIFLTGTSIYALGEHPDFGLSLRRQSLATGALGRSLTLAGPPPGGLAPDALGYFVASHDADDGFKLMRFEHITDWLDSGFGDYGEVVVADPTDVLESIDLAADEAQVYVIGRRTTPGGDSAWLLEARDGATGTPSATFGTSGRLVLDRVVGGGAEAPVTAQTDGASLFVLGAIAGVYRIEKRSVLDGSLVTGFASGGVLELPSYSRVVDLALHDGYLYIVGVEPGGSVLERYDALDGAPSWLRATLMDDPECITATDTGVYIGGSRDGGMHLERWGLDGIPEWARTAEAARAPAGIRAIAYQAGSHWIHSVGYYTSGVHREWYYDRRSIHDGYRHTHAPGAPPE